MAKVIEEPLIETHPKKRQKGLRSLILDVAPILQWLPAYNVRESIFMDVSGAVTLGCILIGQSLAHADLAGVKLIVGPYSCMLGPAIYSIFGTCIHSSIGTGALICLLVGESLKKVGDTRDVRTELAPVLTTLVGVVLALTGLLQLSSLVRFLSRPALSGFITGSSLLAMLSQVAPMMGLGDAESIQSILAHHPSTLEATKAPTFILSALSVIYLLNAKHLKKSKFLKPLGQFKELVILGIGAVFCFFWNPHGISPSDCQLEAKCVKVVGHIPSGLPSGSLPPLLTYSHLIPIMLPDACLVALVAFLTSFAGAKKFALEDGYQISPFNELIAMGFCNVGGAFIGAIPTSIGNTRMGIARQAGVISQLGANVFVAAFIVLALYLFTPYLFNIPMCALNAIIVIGSSHMLEFSHALELAKFAANKHLNWKTRMDIGVWLVGFGVTLYYGALKGILSAVFLSLFIIVFQVVNPEIQALGFKGEVGSQIGDRKWVSVPRADAHEEQGILVFRFEGPLFYANVEQLHEWLENQEIRRSDLSEQEHLRAVIFSATAVPFMDTSAVGVLKELIKAYSDRGVLFLIANTFSSTGRVVSEMLEETQKIALPKELHEHMHKCSTIDDFVGLANKAEKFKKKPQCLRTFGRSQSGALKA